MKFSELQLNANVLEALDAMRFDECTPIQEQAIPIILEGKDLIAVAQTVYGQAPSRYNGSCLAYLPNCRIARL